MRCIRLEVPLWLILMGTCSKDIAHRVRQRKVIVNLALRVCGKVFLFVPVRVPVLLSQPFALYVMYSFVTALSIVGQTEDSARRDIFP